MSEDYRYSVAVCNYNMENTIEESLTSILENVNDSFEVVVIDESTDSSPEIVRELQESYDNLRLVEIEPGEDRTLGRARNIAREEANAKFVLMSMDADDRYSGGIVDFVRIYEQLREELGRDFYLSGNNINISSKEFLVTDGRHRDIPIGAAEEDFQWRMQDQGDIIYLKHDRICEEIDISDRKKSKGYGISKSIESNIGRFQVGVTFWSLFTAMVLRGDTLKWKGRLVYLVALPVAYILSLQEEKYEIPDQFRDYTSRDVGKDEIIFTLEELEEEYDITIDRSELSGYGKEIYLSE